MRNTFARLVCAVVFFILAGHHPALAAVTTQTIAPCREANTDCWPAAFAFDPNGRIFYAERYTGQIRIYNQKTDTDTRFATIKNIGTDGEQGVLGIALDPRWPDKKWIYLYYTNADPEENRVIRIRKAANGKIQRERLMTIGASGNHNGGVIHFGPDGKLYVVTGENGDPANSQDMTNNLGKMLRINKNGSIPTDNPFGSGSSIFSYGNRNSFGFTFNPYADGVEIWESENGPSCNDELNIITGGQNFGWGAEESCPDTNQSGEDRVAAAYTWETVIAPTGIMFCNGCHLGFGADADSHTLLMGAWDTSAIYAITTNDDRTAVDSVTQIYQNTEGILAVNANNNGRAYFSDRYGIYKLVKE